MRIRFLKQCYLAETRRAHNPGDVADISDRMAGKLLSSGLAMQDKSLDGGSKNTSATGSKNKSVTGSKRGRKGNGSK